MDLWLELRLIKQMQYSASLSRISEWRICSWGRLTCESRDKLRINVYTVDQAFWRLFSSPRGGCSTFILRSVYGATCQSDRLTELKEHLIGVLKNLNLYKILPYKRNCSQVWNYICVSYMKLGSWGTARWWKWGLNIGKCRRGMKRAANIHTILPAHPISPFQGEY